MRATSPEVFALGEKPYPWAQTDAQSMRTCAVRVPWQHCEHRALSGRFLHYGFHSMPSTYCSTGFVWLPCLHSTNRLFSGLRSSKETQFLPSNFRTNFLFLFFSFFKQTGKPTTAGIHIKANTENCFKSYTLKKLSVEVVSRISVRLKTRRNILLYLNIFKTTKIKPMGSAKMTKSKRENALNLSFLKPGVKIWFNFTSDLCKGNYTLWPLLRSNKVVSHLYTKVKQNPHKPCQGKENPFNHKVLWVQDSLANSFVQLLHLFALLYIYIFFHLPPVITLIIMLCACSLPQWLLSSSNNNTVLMSWMRDESYIENRHIVQHTDVGIPAYSY